MGYSYYCTVLRYHSCNMAGRRPTGRKKKLSFRADPANEEYITTQAKAAKHGSITNYLNWLIAQDRGGRDEGLLALEAKLAATINSLRDNLSLATQSSETTNAFLHAFVKMYLVNVPDADSTTRKVAKTTAAARYQQLLTNAAQILTERDDG